MIYLCPNLVSYIDHFATFYSTVLQLLELVLFFCLTNVLHQLKGITSMIFHYLILYWIECDCNFWTWNQILLVIEQYLLTHLKLTAHSDLTAFLRIFTSIVEVNGKKKKTFDFIYLRWLGNQTGQRFKNFWAIVTIF